VSGESRFVAVRKIPRGRKVRLEILLMFLLLIGSFALVGLLVPFSDNILRPIDEVAATDHRDNAQQERNESLSRPDGRHRTNRASRN